MNKDDEMEKAKKSFMFFLEKIMGFDMSKFHVVHMRIFEDVIKKEEKPIEPLLSTVIIEDKRNNCQIYCLGITQLIKVI